LTHNLKKKKKKKKKNKLPAEGYEKNQITDQYWYRQGSSTFAWALCFVMVGMKVLVQPSERTTMVNKEGAFSFIDEENPFCCCSLAAPQSIALTHYLLLW